MHINRLLELTASGIHPTVRILKSPWDESFGEPGMLAVFRGSIGSNEIQLDYSEHREHNMALAARDFFLTTAMAAKLGHSTGNAVEASVIGEDLIEELFWDAADDFPVEIITPHSLLGMYIAEASTGTYIEWLEKQLQDLVPGLVKIIQQLGYSASPSNADTALSPEGYALVTRAKIVLDVLQDEETKLKE